MGSYDGAEEPRPPSVHPRNSNHPPNIIRSLPASISRRISAISHDEVIFKKAAPAYEEALKSSNYTEGLSYIAHQPTKNNRNRKRNIIWFNPPFSSNVATNIGGTFLKLINKHFPKTSKLHKIFNRNTVKNPPSSSDTVTTRCRSTTKNTKRNGTLEAHLAAENRTTSHSLSIGRSPAEPKPTATSRSGATSVSLKTHHYQHDKRTLLNKRPELISKCRHENKFYINNSSPTTNTVREHPQLRSEHRRKAENPNNRSDAKENTPTAEHRRKSYKPTNRTDAKENTQAEQYTNNRIIPPPFLKKSDVLTSFELIHKFLKGNLKDSADAGVVKTQLAYLANNYVISHKPSTTDLRKYKILKKLKRNSSIVILKPDKGNGVVIIDRQAYNEGISSIINDETRFQKIKIDPTLRREGQLQRFLRKLKGSRFFPEDTYMNIYPTGSHPARIYGLPKTHKCTNNNSFPTFRPIVSSIGTYNYNLGKVFE
ncbi:hypothetical protein BSL78_20110 [Apostichopus japonicus]|uniref:Uncharacterized protein n=1 Tax=Stichopus japonicus TaxID=307972 RepID=A0A2G8K4T7_STIJA|nr:hypothetical protein BSL78_20110 [Apostichopus japonicus]